MGPLFAVNTVLIVLFQMVLTHGVERFPRGRVAAVGAAFLGLGFGLMPFGRGWLYGAMTVAVWTIGEMLFIPTATTLISLRAVGGEPGPIPIPPQRRLRARLHRRPRPRDARL